MNHDVKLNRYGFYTLIDVPSERELQDYYAHKYYQENHSVYKKSYSDEEHLYIKNKIKQKYSIIQSKFPVSSNNSFLDIGCGEGFALKFFDELNWKVTGLDYSKAGVENHNPAYKQFVTDGDIFKNISALKKSGAVFDLIWIDNVLEHVLNPLELLNDCHQLISEKGILMIEVPNDFSTVQSKLKSMGLIKNDYWMAIPDHISYFNKSGLINICNAANWTNIEITTDFPIDFNLFHPNANYNKDNSTGKGAHLQRIRIENMLHGISIEKTNNLYKAMADMGIGRQIIGFFKKK